MAQQDAEVRYEVTGRTFVNGSYYEPGGNPIFVMAPAGLDGPALKLAPAGVASDAAPPAPAAAARPVLTLPVKDDA